VEPWRKLLRWLFSRCAGCEGRFRWSYYPVSGQWYTKGPSLFGEESVWHHECHKRKFQKRYTNT
jgi:hypothetical protein